MGRIIFRGANLLDGRSAARPATTVVVEGERIVSVAAGEGPKATADDRVIEMNGRTLMPGLITCHYHAAYDGVTMQPVPLGTEKPAAYLAVAAARNVELALQCGYTGIVSAGGPHDIDAQLKMLIDDGVIQGPRIVAGSRGLDTTGDYNQLGDWWWEIGNHGGHRYCDGADAFRKGVRDEIRRGAEIIKLFPSGGHGIPEPNTTRGLSSEELRTAIETAHERGMKARAHCPWKRLILECIDYGIDLIDHGDELDAEVIQALVANDVFLVPSMLFLKKLLGDVDNVADATPEQLAPIRGDFDNMRKMLPEAQAAGVKIVTGDDFGLVMMPHGSYAEELELYVKTVGIAPLEVLRWATGNGAELMGRSHELGSVEEGKLADLLVVDGDPSVDIALLQDRARIQAVMKGGAFARDDL